MRHESCLTCLNASLFGDLVPDIRDFAALIRVQETLTAGVHHHHAETCGHCGAVWFDDIVMGSPGIPVASRRDTVFCECPDDGCRGALLMVPGPESACRCTAATIRDHLIRVPPMRGGR